FAAETDDLLRNATAKLQRKRLDLIVANDVSAPGVGFQHDTNAVTLLLADGSSNVVELSDKGTVAKAVLDTVNAIRGTHPQTATRGAQ
ncbi:MAG: phosphopantothenoylcysteine decarboxylase, partial [Actinomycetota bacterium]